MSQRIKGQEVELLFVVDGVQQTALTDIRSFDFETQLDLLKEGYLGEPTDRRDEIFRGVRGKMDLHFEEPGIFDFVKAVVDRAKRRLPGTKINIKATLNFPSGERARILIQNAFFGSFPLSFGSRSDYGTVAVEYEAENFEVI